MNNKDTLWSDIDIDFKSSAIMAPLFSPTAVSTTVVSPEKKTNLTISCGATNHARSSTHFFF